LGSIIRRHPLVVTPHGSVYSYGAFGSDERRLRKLGFVFHNALLKLVFRRATKIVALSREELGQFSRFGVEKGKTLLIPNPLDEASFLHLPPCGHFKRQYNIGHDNKVVLVLGRLNKIKGPDVLVRAFARLMRDMQDGLLVIAGSDDSFLTEIKNLIKKLQCEDRVIIVGPLYGRTKLQALVDSSV